MREQPDYAENLKSMTKTEIHWFIRGNLVKKGKKLRFRMSGGDDGKRGSCTIHNQKVLNIFAYLGIYDYTHFLFLDFNKGCPSLALRYLDSDGVLLDEDFMHGYSTTEIIYGILKLTVLSDNKTRRRDQ